jgi:pyruvate/2-oxoglutarate dehydrogenase complex dihydrolipoamide acyltransferase (E2) component
VTKGEPRNRVLPYPDLQRQGSDWSEIMRRQHTIHGMLEADITETRRAVHAARRKSGEPLSLTALIVATFARAVALDPSVQGYRKGRSRVVVFEDVDVAVLVEHVIDGERIPLPHIVRAAQSKTPAEIDREIRDARLEAVPYARAQRFVPLWLWVPAVFRRFAWTRVLANPYRRKRLTGTASVTAVGMFGRGGGWGVPFISHSICLTIGGVARRPGFDAAGQVAPREFVSLTISVDHDVANGAPVARLISGFRDSLESAAALRD